MTTGDHSSPLGEFVRTQRRDRCWTQRQVASRVVCSVSMICRLEAGTRMPDPVLAAALDRVFDTDERIQTLAQRPRTRAQDGSRLPRVPELIGRQAALERLTTHVAAASQVTITGMPGVGKTALVMAWAATCADQFPDGVYYADGRGAASEVLGELLSDLGVADLPETVVERGRLWRAVTRTRRVLVILDDLDDAEQIATLAPAGAAAVLLVVSRRWLQLPGARMMLLGPLDHSAGAQLFQHVTFDAADGEAAAWSAACEGLPVALLAAAETQHHATESEIVTYAPSLALQLCGSLRDGLSEAYARLASRPAWIVRWLGETDTALVTAAGIAGRLQISHADAQEAITALFGASFLLPGVAHYRCLRVVRAFARSVLATERSRDGS